MAETEHQMATQKGFQRLRFWLMLENPSSFGCHVGYADGSWNFWSRTNSECRACGFKPVTQPADRRSHDHSKKAASLAEAVGFLIAEVMEACASDLTPKRPFKIGFCDYHSVYNWTTPAAPEDQEVAIVAGAPEAIAYIVKKIISKWATPSDQT